MSGNKVVLFGASGYTGSLTAPVLAQHGFDLVLAGRDRARLEAIRRLPGLENCEIAVADPLQPESLPYLFENHPTLLVNCVGPFTLYGEAVVKAALKAGVHYLDITGEQEYLARVIKRYHALAQEKQVAIIPGCGVEYALGNWAAALAADELEPLDTISVANAVALKGRGISSGSILSLLEVRYLTVQIQMQWSISCAKKQKPWQTNPTMFPGSVQFRTGGESPRPERSQRSVDLV